MNKKTVFIDYISAAAFWHAMSVAQGRANPGARWIDAPVYEPFARSTITHALDGACATTDLRRLGIKVPAASKGSAVQFAIAGMPLPSPLHVSIADPHAKAHSPFVVRHLRARAFPEGSFRRVSHDLLVASPELTFVRMASYLCTEDLIEYGFMLCGLYSLARDGAIGRAPLTTIARLSRFATRFGNSRNVRAAQRALRFVADRSASQRETHSCMLLCVPRLLGGRAYEVPCLNRRIDIPSDLGLGMDHFTPDFWWSARKLVVEYDGREAHQDSQRDAFRRNVVEALGLKTYTLVNAHFKNSHNFDAAAEEIRKKLGYRSYRFTLEERNRQLALQLRLLGASHDRRWLDLLERGIVPPGSPRSSRGD